MNTQELTDFFEMSTQELTDFFESWDFQVHLFTQDGKQGAELETYTNAGVNMVHLLMPFTIEEFCEMVNAFDVDEQIEIHRQDENYRNHFSIRYSLNDFEKYHKRLKNVAHLVSPDPLRSLVEQELMDIFVKMEIDRPSNTDEILNFIIEEIEESIEANWTTEDVHIGFKDWIESKAVSEKRMQFLNACEKFLR